MKTNKLLSLVLAFVICFAAPLTVNPFKAFAADGTTAVAKVGNTEYATIDEAIANWTNGTTLTLLADVTLSSTIDLSSTEHHILDLGTFTMSYPGKTAINIVNNGRSSASYALDIKADATNPGGITANTIVNTKGKSGVQDRPIIRFYNGVFTGSYVVKHSGSNGTKCPQFWFYGGEFNGSISTNRAMMCIYDGTFHGAFWCSVDSSAWMGISGGRFKQLSNLMNSEIYKGDKFVIGTEKGKYDRYIYVNDEGYYNVVETPHAENAAIKAAVIKTDYGSNDYFYHSTANDPAYGMGYTSLEAAIKAAGSSQSVRVLETNDEIVLSTNNVKFDMTNGGVAPATVIKLAENVSQMTITFAEGNDAAVDAIKVNGYSELYDVKDADSTKDGIVTRTYTQTKIPEAIIGDDGHETFEAAVNAANSGDEIILNMNVSVSNLTIDKSITLNLNGKTLTLNKATARALADLTLAKGNNIIIKNGNLIGKEGEDILVQNLSNLTLENVTLKNVTLNVTNDQDAGLLTLAEGANVIDSTILAAEEDVAFNVKGNASVSNSEVQGLIKLTSGKLTTDGANHEEVGDYIQLEENAEIVRLDDYKFDIAVTKNALKTGETLTATISLDKDFYSTEFTFTYNTSLFECSADTDGDGVIYMILFSKEGVNYQSLATFELKALNTINNVTSTKLEVSGNVIQYKEQAINQYVNEAKGDEEAISISLNYEVEIYADYVSGYSLVLVYGADGGYAYDGSAMFYMKDYGAYAFIVEGGVSPAGVDAVISKASGCKEIKISYDVNCEFVADGKVDLKDATAAYACSVLDFSVADYMALYLRADVSGDFKVDMEDYNTITASANYVK